MCDFLMISFHPTPLTDAPLHANSLAARARELCVAYCLRTGTDGTCTVHHHAIYYDTDRAGTAII
jgi:hypothetical protein